MSWKTGWAWITSTADSISSQCAALTPQLLGSTVGQSFCQVSRRRTPHDAETDDVETDDEALALGPFAPTAERCATVTGLPVFKVFGAMATVTMATSERELRVVSREAAVSWDRQRRVTAAGG